MMKILLVHAHPEAQSFCSAMKNTAREEFLRQGAEVRESDLYAMNFQPVAQAGDFLRPENPDYCNYALEQRHAVKEGTLSADIAAELEKLLWCDLLVVVFPLYWFSLPAMLKGWFDRVFVSGVVYGGRRIYDRGGLLGKHALLGITLGGQEHMFGENSIHGPLPELLKPVLQGTLAYSGMTVLPPFIGWHIPYISAEQRAEVLRQWRQSLNLQKLAETTPLVFPKMENFDRDLRPLN